jgi:transcriptional regulator with XRE-family HTH domain
VLTFSQATYTDGGGVKLNRDKLIRAREMLGYGIETVAAEAGVSKNSVLRAEHEEDIRPLTARKIAAALGVRVADLIGESETLKAQPRLPDFNGELRPVSLRSQINLVNNLADYAEQEIQEREQEPEPKYPLVEKIKRSRNAHWALAMMHMAHELSIAFTEDPNMAELVYETGEVTELYRAHRRLDAAVDRTRVWFGDEEQANVRDLDEYRRAQQARDQAMERQRRASSG